MYAIVKTGGKQYKVAEGDTIKVEKLEGKPGDKVSLTPVMLVDGGEVTTGANELASHAITAEILEQTKGPKIRILKYKSKTGYKKRQGHRQKLTVIKIGALS